MEKTIKTVELIERFGTKTNLKAYIKNKKLPQCTKNSLVLKAKQECDIQDLGGGEFLIKEFYPFKKPKCLIGNTDLIYIGLYRMILEKVKEGFPKKYPLILPKVTFANDIFFINKNFNSIKYNKEGASEYFNLDGEVINDFCLKTKQTMCYYIERALKTLQEEGIIEFNSARMVSHLKVEFSNTKCSIQSMDAKVATPEENIKIIEAEESTLKELGISSMRDAHYGVKSKEFRDILTKKLNDMGIAYCFFGYSVYYRSKEKVGNFLKWYDEDFKYNISTCNSEFIGIMHKNAKNRYEKDPSTYYGVNYVDGYLKLLNSVVPYDEEHLKLPIYGHKNAMDVSVMHTYRGVDIEVSNTSYTPSKSVYKSKKYTKSKDIEWEELEKLL